MANYLNDVYDISDEEDRSLTYEEVWAILEEELELVVDNENPYRPLNFHDPLESYEE